MNRKKPPSVPPVVLEQTRQAQAIPPGGGLRIEEAAQYSGFTVSYIRTKITDGTLIPARAGKRFLLTRAQLDKHIADLQRQEEMRRGVA